MKLVVLGAGESGVGAAILGKKKGYNVFVSDNGTIDKKYRDVLLINEISFEENGHSEELLFLADVVVKSPGIPDSILLIRRLHELGIRVVSEIEFASEYTEKLIVGITGSNGKTTTTMLIDHILKRSQLNFGVGGNIGNSFAEQVSEEKHEGYVLELSSFQLDGIVKFTPHIAIMTNITPDHLDRYDNNLENYVDSKFRIIMNQTENNLSLIHI